jgi:hypothetical protein
VVVSTLSQRVDRPQPRFYIGEGKAQTYLPPFLEMIRTYRAMR